jgi:outer membrane lipoprotein-sorting protein
MKTRSRKGLAVACFLLLTSMALAADQQVETLLSHMRDAYKAVKSATCTTTATIWGATESGDQPVEYQTDLAYKSPNLMRIILKGGPIDGHLTIMSDGTSITVTTSQGTRTLGPYKVDTINRAVPVLNLESICFWDWETQLSTATGKNMANSTFKIVKDEEWEGKHWLVLEETAAKDKVFCRYFIDPKTYLIWRTKVSDLETKKTQFDAKVTSMNSKANLGDEMFKGA